MGDPDMNEVLLDVAWFDIETSNKAVFASNAIDRFRGKCNAAVRPAAPDPMMTTSKLNCWLIRNYHVERTLV